MAQVTIYLDEKTRARVERAARRARKSISQWVKEQLESALESRWPDRYFELFGSLAGEELERPPEPDAGRDAPRHSL